jgi:hypothetical protein
LWQSGTVVDIGASFPVGTRSIPEAINNLGQVAIRLVDGGSTRAWVWQNGIIRAVDPFGGETHPMGIDPLGRVLGMGSPTPGVYSHAFRWDDGQTTDLSPSGPCCGVYAKSGNSAGDAVGSAPIGTGPDNYRAVLFHQGTMTSLESHVQGTLEAAGWKYLTDGAAINESGEIAGYGLLNNGETHAFLLKPVPPDTTPPTASICPIGPQVVGNNCSAVVALDGTCSSDPDNDPLTYTWTGPFGTVTGPNPTATLPKGIHAITLTVDDGEGGTATDTVVVTVVDQTPPTINIWPDPKTIYVGVATSTAMPDLTGDVRATDNCTAASALAISQTPASGTQIVIGTTDVIIRVEDASGNAASTTTTVTVSSATAVKLNDSTGNPIAGGVVQFYSGSWQSFGVTGADGTAVKQIPFGNYTFRMNWAGRSNDKVQNVATAPLVTFQTVNAVVQLRDSSEAPLDTGMAQYYGSSWTAIGTTSGGQVSRELLPGTYGFRMSYAGISNDKAQNIAADPTVIFRTTNVAVLLKDSSGASLDPGMVQYHGNSWLSFGATAGGLVSRELLPGNISFRMTYGGFSQDKQQNTLLNPALVFQTVRITAQLLDSMGSPLDPGTVQYYASAWNAFGTTTGGQVQKELLPGTYSFRMAYAGFSQDKQQNVGANPLVVFQTVLVSVQLADRAGNPLDTGNAQYYASAWNQFGTTSGGQTQRELLPGTYSFRMSYAGGSIDKVQNVGSTPVVRFQTGKVWSASGTCTSYYAGAWRTFINGMELLPISYPFRFTGYPQTNYLIAAGPTTSIY